MRKALIPMVASLALCGAATAAMILSSAKAETGPHTPVMVAAMTNPGMQMAANDGPPPPPGMQLAANDMPPPGRGMSDGRDRGARMKEMCTDLYARQTARLAYLETSLQLTAAERPLFERWKDARLAIAHRQADNCTQRVAKRGDAPRGAQAPDSQHQARRERPSPADRMAREENFLKQRLADIEQERPALEAFYNTLTPTQKAELERAGMRERGREAMMHHRMFADARGPRGMGPDRMGGPMGPHPMGQGPMGQGPMGAGPMDRMPGPPDAPPPER